ncbi:MAG: nickel-dependent lactate racemase [Veillonellales bacterium]
MLKKFMLGFGDKKVKVSLPEERIINVVEGKSVKAITDVKAAVKAAINNPIGTPPLREIVRNGDKVAIVASDVTRKWIRYDMFLPTLLDELNAAGIPDSDITLVAALGAHRGHTDEENVSTYGQEVVDRVTIEQSHALNKEDFVDLGTTTRGNPVSINKHVANADKVILTGGIVYHLMAGFGGGRKSVMPGISSYDSIQANHALCLNNEVGKGISDACVSGKVIDNRMHEDMSEMAKMVNPAFILNAVFTADGNFARFVAGHWYKAWEEGCKTVEEIFGVSISGKADLVIASAGGFPKDINLYQGSKTVDNAFMAVKKGGVVILVLECRDIAEPPDFSDWFQYESLYDREVALRKAFTVPGFIALKFGIMAQTSPFIVVTLPENKAFVEKVGMAAVTTIEEAITLAEQKLGRNDYTITIMPHAANTAPLIK